MTVEKPVAPRDPPGSGGSVRVRLARAALQAALAVPGVLGSDPGQNEVRLTDDPSSGLLVGVSVTAQADDRYTVDLALIADMVPLPELAEQVRTRVQERARRQRLKDALGSINVEFASVVTPEELAAAAAEEAEEARAVEELAATVAAEATAAGAAATERAAAGSGETTAPVPAIERSAEGLTSPLGEVSAFAARQAALATDQAALAAKQAALAAEQAALAGGPGVTLPRLPPAPARESSPEHGEERAR